MTSNKLDDAPVVVFACTEEDMREGGFGPLPRDPRAFHKPSEAEREHLVAMFRGFDALQNLGWREASYAPRDGSPLLLIEAGSTGIHEGHRDGEGRFWAYDGDTWPSRPILWKPLEAPDAD